MFPYKFRESVGERDILSFSHKCKQINVVKHSQSVIYVT